MKRFASVRSFALFSLLVAAACSKSTSDEASRSVAQSPTAPANTTMGALSVTSTAFNEGATIPARFTCEGDDLSPPLAWSEAPSGTKSFAVVVDDPDAPDPAAPTKTFVHWVLVDVPPTTHALSEGVKALPQGAREGENDFGKTGYRGPCPPKGRHRYVFKVYALDIMLPRLQKPHGPELESAIGGHVLARGQLIGMYQKGGAPKT